MKARQRPGQADPGARSWRCPSVLPIHAGAGLDDGPAVARRPVPEAAVVGVVDFNVVHAGAELRFPSVPDQGDK